MSIKGALEKASLDPVLRHRVRPQNDIGRCFLKRSLDVFQGAAGRETTGGVAAISLLTEGDVMRKVRRATHLNLSGYFAMDIFLFSAVKMAIRTCCCMIALLLIAPPLTKAQAVYPITPDLLLRMGFKKDEYGYRLEHVRFKDVAGKLGFSVKDFQRPINDVSAWDIRTVAEGLPTLNHVDASDIKDVAGDELIAWETWKDYAVVRIKVKYADMVDDSLDPESMCSVIVWFRPTWKHTDSRPEIAIESVRLPKNMEQTLSVTIMLTADGNTPLALDEEQLSLLLFDDSQALGNKPVFSAAIRFNKGNDVVSQGARKIITVFPGSPQRITMEALDVSPRWRDKSPRWSDISPGDYILRVGVSRDSEKQMDLHFNYQWLGWTNSKGWKIHIKPKRLKQD